jgi:hypothetical protein
LRIIFAWVSPRFWQNLMQYRCCKRSVILGETRMRQTRVTLLCYLAATYASGDVARQQEIMHAHESIFYHCCQFPHPFAITYRLKDIVGYSLDRPCMLSIVLPEVYLIYTVFQKLALLLSSGCLGYVLSVPFTSGLYWVSSDSVYKWACV